MKQYLLTLFMAVAVLFSCSKDNNNANEENNSIVGTWKATEFNGAEPVDFNGDGKESKNVIEELPCLTVEITFTAEGAFTSETTPLELTTENESFVASCGAMETEEGTYVMNDDSLTLTSEQGIQEVTFSILNNILTVSTIDDADSAITLVLKRQ